MSYDPNKTYFPRGEIIRQFAHAFVEGNARTCGFEREFYMLQAAISGEPEFGKDNRWAAEDRPKKLAKLIRDHLGSIPEADTIRKILKDAIPAIRRIRSPCCARAARGHAAVPPSSVMNSRRLIGFSSSFHRRKAVILPDCRAWPVYRGRRAAMLVLLSLCSFCIPM